MMAMKRKLRNWQTFLMHISVRSMQSYRMYIKSAKNQHKNLIEIMNRY